MNQAAAHSSRVKIPRNQLIRIPSNTWPSTFAAPGTAAQVSILRPAIPSGKADGTMWTPTADEFRLLQMIGLATLALIFGARVVPPLQPHAFRIGVAATALYVLFGLAVIAWHALGRTPW